MQKEIIKEAYSNAALYGSGCGCKCGDDDTGTAQLLGYDVSALASLPDGANLGLGCGNPIAFAKLQLGEKVLDLGSGAGIDCFLAAREVGEEGYVYGVDMTEAMIEKARANAEKHGAKNVEFRLGEIENLPLPDESVDVVISNCVINLSSDKPKVFQEMFRALKKGGRVAISDIVALKALPQEMLDDKKLLSGCVSGASSIDEIKQCMTEAGFESIRIRPKEESKSFLKSWADGGGVEKYISSAIIDGKKPMSSHV